MATEAHCAYCFETLSANLEKRTPLSLAQVARLWKQYTAEPELENEESKTPHNIAPPELQVGDAAITTEENTAPSSFRPQAVSRLLAPSPSSTASSSTSIPSSAVSTPSGLSEASSVTSKNSSRSSFFSSWGRNGRKLEAEREDEEDEEESPLFVTWNSVSSRTGEKRLRGCIGTFEPLELAEGLRSYALTSAFDDTRFAPISRSELPTLSCGVTLLTNFEPVSDPLDWEIGIHGLRISFSYHGRRYGSTYLPDVAREQGWTKDETMVSLMRKAGWQGRKDDWRGVGGLSVVRYRGKKVELGYREWKEWREWVEGL